MNVECLSVVLARERGAILMNCHSTEKWASEIRTFRVRMTSFGAPEVLQNTGARFTTGIALLCGIIF